MIQNHAEQNAEHYKLLRENSMYRDEFITDCLREEIMMNMPYQPCPHDDCQKDKDYCCDCCNGDLYISPDQPEPKWSNKQWDYVQQLESEITGWRQKHSEMMKTLDQLAKRPKKSRYD